MPRCGVVATLVVALIAALAGQLGADIIYYKDGRKLEGEILERTSRAIKVKSSFGTFSVDLDKIDRIEEKLTPSQELARRRAEIPDDNAPALYQLALWAQEIKLHKEHLALLREVLAADPAHRRANELMGRVEIDGRWLEPEEVEAYLASVEAEKRAQGLIFHEGEFLPEDEVMRARGFARYNDAWLPRREAETLQAVDDLATLVGVELDATPGEFVTIYADVEPELVDDLLFNLDAEVRDFLRRLALTELEVAQVTRFDIPIYLLPDQESVDRFVTDGFLDRYAHAADAKADFVGKPTFGLHWPRPVLVLRDGHHLDNGGDRKTARRGLLSHHVATLLVERLKGSRDSPGWARVGLTAFYEGATNYYSTVSIALDSSQAFDAEGQPIFDLWVRGWETFPEWRNKLRDEQELAGVGRIDHLLFTPWQSMDSRDVGLCWSFVRFLLERHPTEFATYLRSYDNAPDKAGGEARLLHNNAWAASFAGETAELEREWHGWCMAQPRVFPADELDRM